MEGLKKKPSEIRFSQKEIWHRFRRRSCHSHLTIGDTLDRLMNEECFLGDIPQISIKRDEDKELWITADNRRLWVFKQLERLGRCGMIEVQETSYIDPIKMSSDNNGESVRIKYDDPPGGVWHSAPDAEWIDPLRIKFSKKSIDNNFKYSRDYENITVRQLKDKIIDGTVTPNQIPSIIVLKTEGSYKVCDGNKRLWAITGANKEQPKELKICAIVFDVLTQSLPEKLRSSSETDIYYDDCCLE